MKTRRPISINNSLVHGICNYSCRLCAVNKPNYHGPKEYQGREVTEKIISRVREAAAEGLRIRYIGNAGDGEPTLHPEFGAHMDLFGAMVNSWDIPGTIPPEVGVVTNGRRLAEPGILEAFVRNPLTLIVSIPTTRPDAYGEVMVGDSARGAELLENVLSGVEKAMRLCAQGRLQRLQFHIAPPAREIVRRGFPETVECLSSMAGAAGMKKLELICFPGTANRSGLVRNHVKGCDMYRDLFREYNGKVIHGVRVAMSLSFQRFMPAFGEFLDLIRAYNHPCVWNSQMFITASGISICCNDQAVRNPMGNIMVNSLRELVEKKENYVPGPLCAACDQAPAKLRGSPLVTVFGWVSASRLRLHKAGAWFERLFEAAGAERGAGFHIGRRTAAAGEERRP